MGRQVGGRAEGEQVVGRGKGWRSFNWRTPRADAPCFSACVSGVYSPQLLWIFLDTAPYSDAEKLDYDSSCSADMHQGSVAESQRIRVAPASTSLAVTRPNHVEGNKQCEKKTALLIGAARWTSVTSPSCLVQNVTHTAWQAWVPARSLASRCPQSTGGRRC